MQFLLKSGRIIRFKYIMGEFHSYTPSEAVQFMNSVGYPISEQEILQTYPIYFENRMVLRVIGSDENQDKVLKVRSYEKESILECKKLHLLFSSYRYSGGCFPTVRDERIEKSNYAVFDMSYLGPDLGELVTTLDLIEYGYLEKSNESFRGFPTEKITTLVDQLRFSHMNFAKQHEYVHGDMVQNGCPNNIVYHPEIDCLFLVDAEAMAPVNEERLLRFEKQIQQVEEWMHRNLLETS